ncbi:MAG: hypothetical protein ACFB51_10935 [Anaerolineae bacterium]
MHTVDQDALVKACAVSIGLLLIANVGGNLLYALVSSGFSTGADVPRYAAASLGISVFAYMLYLSFGAAYAHFARREDGLSPVAGAVGGGLTGLITSTVTLSLSALIFVLLNGADWPQDLQQGLIALGVGRLWSLGPTLSAGIVIAAVMVGGTLFGIVLSSLSGALYAASHGPDGYYADYEPPEPW